MKNIEQLYVVYIEAGHGKSAIGTNDPGAVRAGVTERELNVLIAHEVMNKLAGKVAVLPVGVTTSANLRAKIKYVNYSIANNTGPIPLAVSIHLNSSISAQPSGYEIWHQKRSKDDLAQSVKVSMDEYKVLAPRPTPIISTAKHRYGRLYIDDFKANSILIECGFISNDSDRKAVMRYSERIGEAIAHGILEYIRKQK